MLTLFFTITFLAELIVASWIISKIKLADKYVCNLNQKIVEFNPILKSDMEKTRKLAELIHSKLSCLTASIEDKTEYCKKFFKSELLTKIFTFMLKIPYKKILTILDIIFTMKKLLRV